MDKSTAFILWFDELGIEDVPFVGGKNASLGEMYRNLTKKGVSIPNGFAVSSYAYKYLLEKAGIENEIKDALKGLNTNSVEDLALRGHKIRSIIRNAQFPQELIEAIINAYNRLCKEYGKNTDVAVRSSATAEDLPDASFAGQQETYLNIRGPEQLIEACKKCFASLFTNRAISYRVDKKFDHFSVYLSIGVQKMVRSDLASSGVMFSIDTESGFKDAVFITGAYGLGENVVQGAVNPDEYYVFKPTLKQGYNAIISKEIGSKKIKMIYDTQGSKATTKNIPTPEDDRKKFVINDSEILTLAKWACIIEDHYSQKAGKFKPMDMEWAKDGQTGKLFIVQARPETVMSQKDVTQFEEYQLTEKGKVLVVGHSVGQKIGQGPASVIKSVADIKKFKKGEVLVTDMTDPDWEPIMKIASGIVTNRGGRTCFAENTRLLTNKGFMAIKEIYETDDYTSLQVPSLNRSTLKIEWKPIIAVMKKKAHTIQIAVSQTGKAENNTLILTPDHKMINIRNWDVADTEIKDMLVNGECVTAAQFIPGLTTPTQKDKRLAYLLGAISTDGHVYTARTHGEITFVQKPVPEKEEFITAVTKYMGELYNKKIGVQERKSYDGLIRGKPVKGTASAYRLYSKQIAYDFKQEQELLTQTILSANEEIIYSFLGGVIDGDGTFSQKSNRINIYISKEYLAQAVIVACLRLGISPQVTDNRSIYNIQIVEKIDKLMEYTKRVKGVSNRKCQATRFFNARQLFDSYEYGSNINTRMDRNLLISDKDLIKETRFSEEIKNKLNRLINSDIRQLRAVKKYDNEETDVYNITVADNHNYVVFTERYNPVLVNNCHAAIVSRELGIPCVVGTGEGTEKIKQGQKITVSCAEGEDGKIYEGILKFKIIKHDLRKLPKIKTKIMMNLGNPEQAFEMSFLPNDGIGLAREEFIINSYIKVHPKALMDYNKLVDLKLKEEIDNLTYGYADKTQFFVDKLAYGIGRIAAAFYPKKVILRFSDFKSNEYANLIGGTLYEPKEDNPMIGWRGASRYYSPKYMDAFALECKAVKRVRDEMGLKNVETMIPMCRTTTEGIKVLDVMKKNGLARGKNGLKVNCMCEVPSNVLIADKFLDIFDGFSIGSNDLTQFTLAVDRDSELVASIYDERNEAVARLIKSVIETCNRREKYIGICGQAPSDYLEFAEFLVECRIQSMSLNPDSVIRTILSIAKFEEKLGIGYK